MAFGRIEHVFGLACKHCPLFGPIRQECLQVIASVEQNLN